MRATKRGRGITVSSERLRDNERIWSTFRDIEINIIGTQSLHDLIRVLCQGLSQNFPHIDDVTLACIDPEYEMTRLLEAENIDNIWKKSFVRIQREHLDEILGSYKKPQLGECTDKIQSLIFPGYKRKLSSFASAPLVFQGNVIGSLNQGSRNAYHFTAGRATDLLEHLSAVTAVCIDNVLAHERLKHAGFTDPLTGLFNRRYFDNRLEQEVEVWRRHQKPLTCMFFDIDRFKQINDNFGHHIGDMILQKVSDALGHELRTSDVLARFGGEEFVMLLPDLPLTTAVDIADRLREKIATMQFDELGTEFNVTISVGIAEVSAINQVENEKIGPRLIESADKALYHAKRTGRNKVVVAKQEN